MLNFIISAALTALFSAFAYMVLGKWGFYSKMQLNGGVFKKIADCRLCTVFWVNIAASIVLALFGWNSVFLLTPVFSTILTLHLVKICFE